MPLIARDRSQVSAELKQGPSFRQRRLSTPSPTGSCHPDYPSSDSASPSRPSVDMFSCSLGRAVRTVPSSTITARAAPSASITAIRPLTQRARQRQPGHQRRHSSSKTSIPPDGSKVVAPAQRATSTGRTTRKKSKDATAPADIKNQPFSKQYPHLPSVPSTQHLHPQGMILELPSGLLLELTKRQMSTYHLSFLCTDPFP